MTEDTPLTPAQEDELLAAELALGLLDGEEAGAAVARLSADPGFAEAVRGWQERLAAMADQLTPVMPPARARQRIREALGHGRAPLSQLPEAARPWWRGPLGAVLGLFAVAAVALFMWLPLQTPPAPTDPAAAPAYHAMLVSEDETLRVAARLDGHQMEIAMEQGSASADRDYEIWWIRPDGSAPISIGLVPRTGSMRMDLPEGLDPAEGVRIALSDEPAGGSPTGQATGPIMAVAELTRL